MKAIAAVVGAPTLKLCRVLLATSGTLLMTWTDEGGRTWKIKQQCWHRFPGATVRPCYWMCIPVFTNHTHTPCMYPDCA